MQYGPKRTSNFSTIWLNKNYNKKQTNSVFSCGKLKDSSLISLPGFAVHCLEIVENIGQMHKSIFSF